MNLRTHTYLIPALCGSAAFAALVASDFSVRRLANGEGYGMARYLVEVATPDAKKPARVALAIQRQQAAPAAVAAVQPEPEPEAMPLEADVAVATRPEPAVAAEAATAPVESFQPAAPAEPALDVVRISSQPASFAAKCSADRGFKRCRIGD